MLLAATSKLNKLAREWFDLDTNDINDSWATFKAALSSRFRSRISALEIMDKVEARKWLMHKEAFGEYASQKLKMLKLLILRTKILSDF